MGTRRNNFDGLRLVAAFAVLYSHMFALSGRPQPEIVSGIPIGTVAVMVFFSISGYLVSASWQRDPNLGRFLVRRSLRIGPGLAVVWLVLMVVMSALGLSDGFTMNPISTPNGSLWTIPIEVSCYLILAGCFLLLKRSALLMCLVMLVAAKLQYQSLYAFGLFFVTGALIQQFPILRGNIATTAIVAVGAWMVDQWLVAYYGLSLIVSAVTIWVANRSWSLLRDAGMYGDFSYGVYLYAYPVQQIVVMSIGTAPFAESLCLSVAIVLPLAWLSWNYVEKPALRLKPQTSKTLVSSVVQVCPVTVIAVVQAALSSDHSNVKSAGDEPRSL